MLRIAPLNFKNVSKFCPSSNLVINAYKNKQNFDYLPFPQSKIGKFITFFGKDELKFNATDLFFNYIHSKILRIHSSSSVFCDENMIYIFYDNVKIGILPSFSGFDVNNKNTFEKELKNAYDLGKDLDMVYIAFPKQENLKKFINVKNTVFNSQKLVKIVPYSITNKTIRRNKCQ